MERLTDDKLAEMFAGTKQKYQAMRATRKDEYDLYCDAYKYVTNYDLSIADNVPERFRYIVFANAQRNING